MKKRIVALFVVASLFLLLSACVQVVPVSLETMETTATKPQVINRSSEWVGSSRGKYVATADTGKICEGRAYCEKKNAISNPLEIQANGYEIKLTLVDTEAATEVYLKAGEEKLISCDSGNFNGYLYVIVI